jgi:hypothetical protein
LIKIKIKMTKKHESGILLGEVTPDLWITETKMPIYKNTLLNGAARVVENYDGDEYVELDDKTYKRLSNGSI